MIHQYKSNGYNIVLDVESGAVHVVDDITYDVISLYEENSADEIISKLKSSYNEDEIRECISEVKELVEDGQLFTEDIYEPFVEKFKEKRQTVVKALCLHIAHDCNLACKYCFAEEGEYHGRRALMSFEVGKKALDFLVANSGNRDYRRASYARPYSYVSKHTTEIQCVTVYGILKGKKCTYDL